MFEARHRATSGDGQRVEHPEQPPRALKRALETVDRGQQNLLAVIPHGGMGHHAAAPAAQHGRAAEQKGWQEAPKHDAHVRSLFSYSRAQSKFFILRVWQFLEPPSDASDIVAAMVRVFQPHRYFWRFRETAEIRFQRLRAIGHARFFGPANFALGCSFTTSSEALPTSEPSSVQAGAYRVDIQALRGIAVLYVVIYHAGFGVLKDGFLGVDIFFVISGYLLTGMICRDIDVGRFRITEFYWRRAKRLLPATYITLLAVALLSYLILLPADLAETQQQLLGSLTFTANVVLWLQSGYFDVAAHLKPLLHMWSLSVEEQFYLLLPGLFIVVPAQRRSIAILLLLCASLGTCFVVAARFPDAAFYLLPTRAWELLTGSLGAILAERARRGKTATYIGIVAVIVIVALPFVPLDRVRPRFDALAICIATLVALRTQPRILQYNRVAAALAKVGDVSFSLYLIHWPLLVLVRHVYLRPLSGAARILFILLSIALASALFCWIENPIRRSAIQPRLPIIAGVVAATLVILAIPAVRTFGWVGNVAIAAPRANPGLSLNCNSPAPFKPTNECRNSDNPQIAVWGDSVAMALLPGLVAADPGLGLIQATRSSCGPLLGMAGDAGSAPPDCIPFNDSVRAYLVRSPEIRYVILSSTFVLYVGHNRVVLASGETVRASPEIAEQALGDTVSAIRAMGKKVVIVAPPPTQDFNVGLCTERLAAGFWTWPSDCRGSVRRFRERNLQVISLLNNTSRDFDVAIIWPGDFLCDDETCRVLEGAVPIYTDGIHFSRAGSVAIFKAYDLFNKIIDAAR